MHDDHRLSVDRGPVRNQMLAAIGLWTVCVIALTWGWLTPGIISGSGSLVVIVLAVASTAVVVLSIPAGWAYLYRFIVGGPALYTDGERLVFLHPLFYSVLIRDLDSASLKRGPRFEARLVLQTRDRKSRKLSTYLLNDPDAALAYVEKIIRPR